MKLLVSHLIPNGEVYEPAEALERAAATVERCSGYDVARCERLRVQYVEIAAHERRDGATYGRRGDVVRRLMAEGLSLRAIARYVEAAEQEIVTVISPPAMVKRWRDVLDADERLRRGYDVQCVAMQAHLPLGFVASLASWQLSDVDVRAKELAARLVLERGYGSRAAIDEVEAQLGVTLHYDFVTAMRRPERAVATRARYGIAEAA